MDTVDNKTEESLISQFYANKSIFVTGATGFLGKVILEKMLRSCPELNKIYILVRPKKGKQPHERLDEIFKHALYDKCKEMHQDLKAKVVAIEGDMEQENLGISDHDRLTLIENVNAVFHSAATVRFDEPLKVAVSMNISGVKKVIDLCKVMRHLEVFVHISTAYANCPRLHVSEEVYKPPIKPESILEAMEWMDDELINNLTPKIIGKWPNTYTFTKAIAEYLVNQECKAHNIPCAIVRPSIVCAAWREPIPGWIDNFNGPTALFPACGSGLLRTMIGHREAIADLIPVDIPVNLVIAAGWFVGSGRTKNILVYNCTSGQINKITWGHMESVMKPKIFEHPFEKIVMYPNPNFTTHRTVKVLRTFFEQMLPAYILDFFLKLANKNPLFVRIQNKIIKSIGALEFFTTHEWEFTNDNLFMLNKQLNPADNKIFNFDIRDLHWDDFMDDYYWGTKKFLMKEDRSHSKKNLKQLKKLKRIQDFALISLCIAVARFLFVKSRSFKLFIEFIFEMVMKFGHLLLKYVKLNQIVG